MNATLIYDASCPICTAARDWVERRAVPGEFEYVPCQSDVRAQRFPAISEQQCMEAMQLVYPDGRRFSGDRALPQILLGLKGWRWLARILRVPPASLVSPVVYRLIAKNRMALSALIARKTPDACPTDGSGDCGSDRA